MGCCDGQKPSPAARPHTEKLIQDIELIPSGHQHHGFGVTPGRSTICHPKKSRGGFTAACPPLTHDFEADGAAAGGVRQQLHAIVPAVVAVPQEREGDWWPQEQEEKQQEEGAAPSHGGGGGERGRSTGLSVGQHWGHRFIPVRPGRSGGGEEDQMIRGMVPPAPWRGDELCPGLLAPLPPATSLPPALPSPPVAVPG